LKQFLSFIYTNQLGGKTVSFLHLLGPAGLVYQLKGSRPSCYCQPMEGNVQAY
jgi:hypothetical protein